MSKNVVTETPPASGAPTSVLVIDEGEVARAGELPMGMVAGLAAALGGKASTSDVAAIATAAATDVVAAAAPPRITSGQVAAPVDTTIVAVAPADIAAIAAANGMSVSERSKLVGIEAGAQVNPPRITSGQIATPTDTTIVSSAPADIAAIAAAAGMTSDERSKLAGIAPGATAAGVSGDAFAGSHPAAGHTADQISDTAGKVVMTADERTKLAGIAAGAQVNPSSYTADQITETSAKKVLTDAERTKLAGLPSSQISDLEQIAAAGWPPNTNVDLRAKYFTVQRFDITLAPGSSTPFTAPVPRPVALDAAWPHWCTPRPRNGGPFGQSGTDTVSGATKVTLSDRLTLAIDPTSDRAAAAEAAKLRIALICSLLPAGHPYEVEIIGPISVNFTGTNETATASIGRTLSAADVAKTSYHFVGTKSGGAVARVLGAIPYLQDDGSGASSTLAITTGTPGSAAAATYDVVLVVWRGVSWDVVHYFADMTDANDTGNVPGRSTGPGGWDGAANRWNTRSGTATKSLSTTWGRTMIWPAGYGWRGPDGSALALTVPSNTAPLWNPGSTTDPTDVANVNYEFDAAHALLGAAGYAVAVSDVSAFKNPLKVTRYTLTSFGTPTYYFNAAVTNNRGTGGDYQPGEKLTLQGGTLAAGSAAVASVVTEHTTATQVGTVTRYSTGEYSAVPANPVSTTSDGTGVGCTLTCSWLQKAREWDYDISSAGLTDDGAIVITQCVAPDAIGNPSTWYNGALCLSDLKDGDPSKVHFTFPTGFMGSKIGVQVVQFPRPA